MSAPPYMKLYVADYFGDTHHLGVTEHGAYLLLLMAMWRAGGALPAADANLAKLARCTPDQWAEIRDTILPFFRRRGGRLTHKRIAAEMAKYENTSGKRSEASNARASKKGRNSSGLASAKADDFNSNCTHNQNQNHNQSPQVVLFPEPPERTQPQQRRESARGSRIKPDWARSGENVAYAVREGFSDPEVRRMAENFRDYWTAATGQKAVKLDWSAAWRTWVRKEADNRSQRAPSPRKQVDWIG